MERKEFIKKSLALCGLSLLPAALLESCSQQGTNAPTNVNFTIDLTNATYSALNTVGGSVLTQGIVIMHISTSVYSALSALCTHNGCSLNYNKATTALICPCHGGSFNANTGAVLGGPPPYGLTKYTVTQSGNILTVKS